MECLRICSEDAAAIELLRVRGCYASDIIVDVLLWSSLCGRAVAPLQRQTHQPCGVCRGTQNSRRDHPPFVLFFFYFISLTFLFYWLPTIRYNPNLKSYIIRCCYLSSKAVSSVPVASRARGVHGRRHCAESIRSAEATPPPMGGESRRGRRDSAERMAENTESGGMTVDRCRTAPLRVDGQERSCVRSEISERKKMKERAEREEVTPDCSPESGGKCFCGCGCSREWSGTASGTRPIAPTRPAEIR